MSLTEKYASEVNDISSQDPSWRHFVKDYKNSILATSEIVELTPYQQRIYKYRLRDFLRETNRSTDLTWIIIWLNQLETELNFFNKSHLIIPSYQVITKLRSTYDGSR